MWPPYKLHGWGSHNVSCWMVLCWHWGSFLNAKSFCKTQVLYRCWWFCPLTQITLADLHSVKFKFEMLFFKTLTIFTSIKWTSLMESSKTLWTHPGFFKQRMQSHNFQYFNVTSQRGKKKKKNQKSNSLCMDRLLFSRSFSVLVQHQPWGQMAGESCYWSGNTKDLSSSETRVWVRVSECGVLRGVLPWWRSAHGSPLGSWELSPEPAGAGCSHSPPGLRVSACRLPPQTETCVQKNTHDSNGCCRCTHLPGVPVLLFMIFALVHSHLYGFLILFCGKHKEFGKHSFKYKQGRELLKISNAFKIFSAYLLSPVLNVLSNLESFQCRASMHKEDRVNMMMREVQYCSLSPCLHLWSITLFKIHFCLQGGKHSLYFVISGLKKSQHGKNE